MSTVEHGRPVVPWLVGALAAGVVALALWLANTGPTLAYTTADDEDSAVTCTGRAETNDTPLVQEEAGTRTFFRVDSGEDAFGRVQSEYVGSEDYDPLALDRSINADCAHAVVSRQWTVIWVLTTLVPLAVVFVLMGVARMIPPREIPAVLLRRGESRSARD